MRHFITLVVLTCVSPSHASADVFDWMTEAIMWLTGTCLNVPAFANFHTGSQTLNLVNTGQWVATGTSVTDGKLIKFDWSTIGVTTRPRKYLALYRIDPRFAKPQLFIQTYDYAANRYVSDFHQFKAGELLRYQNNPIMGFQDRIVDYSNYFNFIGRSKIPLYAQDVVNITLINANDFYLANSDFNTPLSNSSFPLTVAYDDTGGMQDNKIIYSTAQIWCNAISVSPSFSTSATCNNNTYLANPAQPVLVGSAYGFPNIISNIISCPDGANNMSQNPLCVYDKGRGMLISVNGKIIKPSASNFINSGITNKLFFYYKTDNAGLLDIGTDWQIKNMFANFPQFMSDWTKYIDEGALQDKIADNSFNIAAKFLHFGRYFMSIEIGNGENNVSANEQDSIKVEYTISTTQPSNSFSGTEVNKSYKTDADRDGYIWLRVINPNSQIQGIITVNYANYTGTTIFSDILHSKIILPLSKKFQDLSKLVFSKLVTNVTVQNIAKTMLVLYIAFYALWFLAGATQITVNDIIIRIIKITIIVTLFSPGSWDFFNTQLFQTFTLGMVYLLQLIVDSSSSTRGIFGFIDPIFDRYTNPKVWGLLLIQLLQIQNGLAFFAIMTIYSLLTFFRAVLEIIIGYCMAFIGLTIMISLAPIFLTLMLFERTKPIFDNWLSTLFDYMMQPTILLIFFLLIDQLIGRQVTDVITKACWGCLIDINIGLDLRHIGIPLDFSFPLPFLPCIPFFVTEISDVNDINDVFIIKGSFLHLVTSTLLLYCYCTMARGLVTYVSVVTSMLTNVQPARLAGKFQNKKDATSSIISDIGGLFNPIKSAAGVFKDKVIDQNYKARPSTLPNRKEDISTHAGKVFKSRYDTNDDNSDSQEQSSSGKNDDKK